VDRPQRQHPRYAHEAAITLLTPGQEISGRTRNVSRGGLCATLSEEIAIGSEIQIDLQLVFENEHRSEALRLPARIAWCTSIDESHQIGAQFLPLDAETSEYLTMFLRYLDDEDTAKAKQAAVSIDDRFG
jgi:c-di-GMP-binding flagellar brake protein YcgR